MTAVTFFINLPFMQVIVTFLAAIGVTDGEGVALCVGVGVGAGVGVGVGVGEGVGVGASCESLTLMVGEEYVNPLAESRNQLFFSDTRVVAFFDSPSA